MKKILSVLLAIIMIAAVLPFTVFAAGDYDCLAGKHKKWDNDPGIVPALKPAI